MVSWVGMPNFHTCHAKIEVMPEKFVPSHTVEKFTYRSIKVITATQRAEHSNGCNWWAYQPREGSLDVVLDCISEKLRGAMEELALLKTVTPKRKGPALTDTELQLLINKRNATH